MLPEWKSGGLQGKESSATGMEKKVLLPEWKSGGLQGKESPASGKEKQVLLPEKEKGRKRKSKHTVHPSTTSPNGKDSRRKPARRSTLEPKPLHRQEKSRRQCQCITGAYHCHAHCLYAFLGSGGRGGVMNPPPPLCYTCTPLRQR